jgi:hypothetical protein
MYAFDQSDQLDILENSSLTRIYTGISFLVFFVLSLPYNLISIFGLFILITYLRVRSLRKKYRGRGVGIKDLFGSISSSMSRNDQRRPLKYNCMNCGKEHREIAHHSCGSKMKRIG